MKYKKPKLHKMFSVDIINAYCESGNRTTGNPSCIAGAGADAGGCANGPAALTKCAQGSAADTKCDVGTCFD